MKAIVLSEPGGPENLSLGTFADPQMGPSEILVKVKASALNRADTLQRKGMYPPPPGASPILGLEMAGVVEAVGAEVSHWAVGDRVCGLLAGGGYAAYVTIHQDLALPIPANLDFQEAAAIPEVFLTAFQAIVYLGQFQAGEKILIHAGASGVGTVGIQLAKLLGADQIIVTASAGKHDICRELGAHHCIDYKTQNFETEIQKLTEGQGVDVIIDFLAAPYFQKNINSLNFDGRMIMLALMGGIKVPELNLVNILRKRLRIIGSTLRARSLDYKIKLAKDFSDLAMSHFETGKLKPIIDSVYSWTDIAAAHRHMESNKNKGKIVLEVGE